MQWNPELAVAGFRLQLNTRQLNSGDQLAQWNSRGWISGSPESDTIQKWPRLASLDDESATLNDRVSSYLDSNCANCHRPGGPSRGGFDIRASTPLEKQNVINGPLLAGDLGIEGAKVLVPGRPDKSALYLRILRKDAMRMPPVALNDIESPIASLLREWIEKMKK